MAVVPGAGEPLSLQAADLVRRIARVLPGVHAAADHPEQAYREVAREVLGVARVIGDGGSWVGSLEPRLPVRALDKCLWWLGRGSEGGAAQIRDPWRIVDELGIDHG